MTVKEIVELTGVKKTAVQSKINELMPGRSCRGRTTRLTEDETFLVMRDLRKKGLVEVTGKRAIVTGKREVDNRMDRLENLLEKMMEVVIKVIPAIIPTNQPPQIENHSQDSTAGSTRNDEVSMEYDTLLGYMNLNKIKSTLAQSKAFGHACSKMSRDLDVSIIKIPDKRYGSVNSYHIDILKKFFSKVKNINK